MASNSAPLLDSRSAPVSGAMIDALPQRIRTIATLRGLGYSFREIAAQFNVTPQAVSIMLARQRRTLKTRGDAVDLANLSARAVHALARRGIRTREEARKMNILALLERERNCGRKTMEEIAAWISAPSPSVPGGQPTRAENSAPAGWGRETGVRPGFGGRADDPGIGPGKR